MKTTLLSSLGIVVAICLFAFVRHKTTQEESMETKIEQIDRWLKKQQVKGAFNGGVLIAKNHKPLLMKGYGYTSYKRNKKITPQSSFRLASVSKQFTAAGIMLLKEKGLLDYDASLTTYFKKFPYPKATVRQLLHHTSGIPDTYMSLASEHSDKIGDVLSIGEVVQLVINYPKKSKARRPNARFKYSNTGYVLLAAVIEKVSGKSFEVFMKKELFEPLKMKNTRVWNLFSAKTDFANRTTGYEYYKGQYEVVEPSELDGVAGDGAVFSSLEDMLIWDKFWYGNTLLSTKNMKQAFSPAKLKSGEQTTYGFGWEIESKTRVSHTGSWLGARTWIVRDTKAKMCIVVLDNSNNEKLDKITTKLEEVFLD